MEDVILSDIVIEKRQYKSYVLDQGVPFVKFNIGLT